MNQTERSPIILPIAVIAVTVLVILAGMNVVKLNQVAHDTAQASLWQQIQHQLKARETQGQFPASLSELHLELSNKSLPEMLQLFDYRTDGSTCEASTTLRGVRKTATFGKPVP